MTDEDKTELLIIAALSKEPMLVRELYRLLRCVGEYEEPVRRVICRLLDEGRLHLNWKRKLEVKGRVDSPKGWLKRQLDKAREILFVHENAEMVFGVLKDLYKIAREVEPIVSSYASKETTTYAQFHIALNKAEALILDEDVTDD